VTRSACIGVATLLVARAALPLDGYILTCGGEAFATGPEVALVNCATGQKTVLASGGGYWSPVFSPDGTQIAYWRNGSIYVMANDGSGTRQVCQTPDTNFKEQVLTWCSNGWIYFAQQGTSLYRARVSDGRVETAHTSSNSHYMGTFSSDGSRWAGSMPSWSVLVAQLGGSERNFGGGCQGSVSPNGAYVTHNLGDHRSADIHNWDDGSVAKTITSYNNAEFNEHLFSRHSNDYVVYALVSPNPDDAVVNHWPSNTNYKIGDRVGAPFDFWPGALPSPGTNPAIALSPTSLSFSATAGGANPAAQNVSVTNSGSGTLADVTTSISYGSGSNWLSVSRSGSGNSQTLANSVNISGLAAGTYTATVSVYSTGASNSPQSYSVTLTVSAAPTLRDPENPSGTVSGLNVSYYELSSPSALPNFGSLTAYKTDTVAEINYPSTDGNFATSGRADNVGAVFTGYVQAPSDGVYTFYTTSDDGSALYIGAQKVVDNDGTHGMQERSGSIGLRAGKHALRVEFFEAGGGAGLVVSWEGPGVGKQTIPASALFRSGSSPVPTTVVVTPASATIDPGGTQLFSAEVRDQNGQPMSATVSWSVSGGGTVSPSTGTSTTFRSDGSTGTFTVTATAGAAQGSAAVTVYSGPWVSISSPAAGEVWYVGTTRRIRWTASGVSVVTLTWSADGGSYWESIATSVRDTDAGWQDYPWVVPDSPSTQCLVRVSGYMGECSAQSGLFEIRAVTDTDSDGMDDGWEIEHFGDLGRDGTADADGDGLTDYEEFMRGTDPNVANGSGGSGAGGFSCSPAGRAGEGSGTLLALGLLVALAAARNRSATLRPRPAPSSGRG